MGHREILKRLEPYFAIAILIFLIFTSVMLYQENKITKKISEDCGWGKEDYYCVCEKGMAQELRNAMEGRSLTKWEFDNVSLVE